MSDLELPREQNVSASSGITLPSIDLSNLEPPGRLKDNEFTPRTGISAPPPEAQIAALVDGASPPSLPKINPEKVKTGLEEAFKTGKTENLTMDGAAALWLASVVQIFAPPSQNNPHDKKQI